MLQRGGGGRQQQQKQAAAAGGGSHSSLRIAGHAYCQQQGWAADVLNADVCHTSSAAWVSRTRSCCLSLLPLPMLLFLCFATGTVDLGL